MESVVSLAIRTVRIYDFKCLFFFYGLRTSILSVTPARHILKLVEHYL